MAWNITTPSTGAGGGTVDSVARAIAAAAQAEAEKVTGTALESVAAGDQVFVDGRLFTNNTAGALIVPATLTAADMVTTGFSALSSGSILDVKEAIITLTTTISSGVTYNLATATVGTVLSGDTVTIGAAATDFEEPTYEATLNGVELDRTVGTGDIVWTSATTFTLNQDAFSTDKIVIQLSVVA